MEQDLQEGLTRIVGTKQTVKAIESGKVELVYLAEDADDFIKRKIVQLCDKHQVPIQYISTMKELGKASGIQVGAALAATLKKHYYCNKIPLGCIGVLFIDYE